MTPAGIPGSDVQGVSAARRENYPRIQRRAEVAIDVGVVDINNVSGYFQIAFSRRREMDWSGNGYG